MTKHAARAGFDQHSSNVVARVDLMSHIAAEIRARGWTQQEAAALFGVAQPLSLIHI